MKISSLSSPDLNCGIEGNKWCSTYRSDSPSPSTSYIHTYIHTYIHPIVGFITWKFRYAIHQSTMRSGPGDTFIVWMAA